MTFVLLTKMTKNHNTVVFLKWSRQCMTRLPRLLRFPGHSACRKGLDKSGGGEEGRVPGVMASRFEEDGQLRGAGRDHSHQGGPEGEGHDRGDAFSLKPPTLLVPGQQRQREGQHLLTALLLNMLLCI